MVLGHISIFLASQQLQTQLHFIIIPQSVISKILLVVCKMYCCVWDLSMQMEPCTLSFLPQQKLKLCIKKVNHSFNTCPSTVSCKIMTFFEKTASLVHCVESKTCTLNSQRKCIELELANWFYLLSVETNI